jgi:hypothetical protein
MAIDVVRADADKLNEMVDSLDTLPETALNELLAFAESDAVIRLPDESRLPIWSKISSFVRKHRRYVDAKWALSPQIVDRIDRVASVLAPRDPMVKHRALFTTNIWDLHDDEDWQKGQERLIQHQVDAVQEIYGIGGVSSVVAFAAVVENPFRVGFALGKFGVASATNELLPKFVLSPEPKHRQLVEGFIWAMWQRGQWCWFDGLRTDSSQKDQIAQVLAYLPFDRETWNRATQLLGNDAAEYWTRVPIHAHQRCDPEYVAVDALLRHDRPRAAVECLASRVQEKLPIDPNRAMDALTRAATSNELGPSVDPYAFEMVIRALQDDENADKDKLMSVEWAYMAVLEHSHLTRAKTLNAAIASDPEFFCRIIRTIFRSERESDGEKKSGQTEEQRAIAMNAYRLLHDWRTVPGTDASGAISPESLKTWIDKVTDSLAESGHLDVGLQKAGEVFIHSPADRDGMFMSHSVANTLNREDMDQLRRGYEIAIYNSRGVHYVDPTGAPEKALAATYSRRADTVENAGYHRLAITFRLIADSYTRDANAIVARSAVKDC